MCDTSPFLLNLTDAPSNTNNRILEHTIMCLQSGDIKQLNNGVYNSYDPSNFSK